MKDIKHKKVSAKIDSPDTSLIRPSDWNDPHDEQIPEALSELTDDATHRTVTDTEKGTWNGKQDVFTVIDGGHA